MPWLGFAQTPPIQITPQQTVEQDLIKIHIKETGDDIFISNGNQTYDVATDTFVFTDGVQVRYGKTVLTANRVTIRPGETKTLTASGKVKIVDPDGTIEADNLELSWKDGNQWGKAEKVVAQILDARITAETMDISPERLEFHDVTGTTCQRKVSTFMLKARNLVVIPGSYAQADKPSLYLFGRKIIDLPLRRYNLDRRSEGIKIPAVGYRQGYGWGVNWTSGFLLNSQSNLTVATSFYPRLRPSLGLLWTRSFVPASSSTVLSAPRSEILERFSYGFLDNIETPTPELEILNTRARRSTLSIGTTSNEATIGLGFNTQISKLFDAAYEIGGNVKGWGLLATSRIQSLRENNDVFSTRGSFRGTISAPLQRIAPKVSMFNRLELGSFLGSKQFTWANLQTGITFRPGSAWSFTVGGFASQNFGIPEFTADQLFATRGFIWRADYQTRLTKFSFLRKWDVNRKWYDQEYLVSQAVGCLEPYVLFRQVTRDFRVGLRLRLDDITDVFKNRKIDRKALRPDSKTILLDGK